LQIGLYSPLAGKPDTALSLTLVASEAISLLILQELPLESLHPLRFAWALAHTPLAIYHANYWHHGQWKFYFRNSDCRLISIHAVISTWQPEIIADIPTTSLRQTLT